MDVAATIIELYFALLESINVRNAAIAIIVIIICIEFIEYYVSPDEGEAPEPRKKKPAKRRAGPKMVRRLFGLDGGSKDLLDHMAEEEKLFTSPTTPTRRASPREAKSMEVPPHEPGARVLGSKTYTVRTILDGNYVYLEKVDDGGR